MKPGLYTGPAWAGLRVGILGGSFNPAHRGHRHISLLALDRLGLDQVWWLVSPQNPLKQVAGMAPFESRFAGALAASRHPRILASDLERKLGTRFTANTLTALRRRYTRTHFVWLMGADNLGQIHRWKEWRRIFETVPVAVFDRPGYALKALAGPAAQTYRRARAGPIFASSLADCPPPAWTFFPSRLDDLSSTRIRQAASIAKPP